MLTGSVMLQLTSALSNALNSSNPVVSIIAIIVYAVLVLILLSLFAYLFGWIERKIIAKVQARHGPTYVGKFGILQNLADIIKLLSKEKITPDAANALLMMVAPQLLIALSVFLVLLIPFMPSIAATNLSLGLLVMFVVIAFFPIILFLAGFSTGNKFADISAQRSVLILLSYELPTILVIAAVALAAQSYNLQDIINAQSSLYYVVIMPIGFIIFFITMLAELERPPFDLLEADSELIAGWLTDVSAPYYSIALFLDYSRMFLVSLLMSILFFGGWLGPVLPPIAWLLIKAALISFFIIIIRATTFRMRIDRILRLGWMWLMPLALINLVLTYIIVVVGI